MYSWLSVVPPHYTTKPRSPIHIIQSKSLFFLMSLASTSTISHTLSSPTLCQSFEMSMSDLPKDPLGKVLVRGGCGFLGSHILEHLLSFSFSSIPYSADKPSRYLALFPALSTTMETPPAFPPSRSLQASSTRCGNAHREPFSH